MSAGENAGIAIMLASAGALIAFLDFVLRHVDDALDDALGKEKPTADAGDNVKAVGFRTHDTSSDRTAERGGF